MALDAAALDAAWPRLEALLDRVLSLQADEPQHANAPSLVLHLAWLPRPRRTRQHGENVLEAIATLIAISERLRLCEHAHVAFWTRVLMSRMMITPFTSADAMVREFAHHARTSAVQLTIEWSSFTPEAPLLGAVRAFLQADWPAYDTLNVGDPTLMPRPVRVALAFKSVALTATDLALLAGALEKRPTTSMARPLVDDALRALVFYWTALDAEALKALASVVIPRARPIDELRLDAVFPRASSAAKSPDLRSVGLSLAFNRLNAVHFRALMEALKDATRPLKLLLFEHSFSSVNDLPITLDELLFSPAYVVADDCELDLTGWSMTADDVEAFRDRIRDRVMQDVALAHEALKSRSTVTCQLVGTTDDYVVVSLAHEPAAVEVVDPTTQSTKVVPVDAIASLAVDTSPVFQPRWTRLRLASFNRSASACAYRRFLECVGFCPHLECFSLEGDQYMARSTGPDACRVLCQLKTLDVVGSNATRWLLRAARANVLDGCRLARLRLTYRLEDHAHLFRLFNALPSLELLDMDYQGGREQTEDFDNEVVGTRPLRVQAKWAFLTIVRKIDGMESHVVAKIFALAEDTIHRRALWRGVNDRERDEGAW